MKAQTAPAPAQTPNWPSWGTVGERIAKEVEKRCEGRDGPRIATNIHLWVSSDQVPKEFPETSSSMEEHLAFLVGDELSEESVWRCSEKVTVHIVPSSAGVKDQFHLDLTWNLVVPEKIMEEMLRHLGLSIQQNSLTADHLHSSRQKLLQFCHPGRSK